MEFFKYQGTGNDFIILDGRNGIPENLDVRKLCDRRFGIGADGLMFLKNHVDYDFEMVYYNSDGNLSSMCGNGGRCLAHYANSLGIGNAGNMEFIAVDGSHKASVHGELVALQMRDVNQWNQTDTNTWITDTGSPHYVHFMESDIRKFDLISFAKSIRYNTEFKAQGINVNIVQKLGPFEIAIRTYERGVEDETLSCGTGVTAAALVFQVAESNNIPVLKIRSEGGELEVLSRRTEAGFTDVVLRGPAVLVYSGEIQ